jgi:glyoxylase-like metal-dependent hydrolase (beta-lactamase superfamily II)
MQKAKISLYQVGYCKHPEFMVKRGGSFASIKFPAMVALIEYEGKNLLFDTGYGRHFFDATAKFPEKLYALTTPVTLEKPLVEMIDKPIESIFISHFHADHIGGLKDFPEAKLYCSKEAYAIAKGKMSRFSKTKMGVLPALLPDDFEERLTYIEDLLQVNLPDFLAPFEKGYLLDNRFYVIELDGHAHGQYGLVVDDTFFVSDSVWDIEAITKGIKPNILTHLIFKDANVYYETIEKLKVLHRQSPALKIVPTHCSKTHEWYKHV